MPDRPKIDDIAKAAFVSRSVVSRVLNNRPNVSPLARARVKEVIERLGYAPSSAARSLATNKTHEISILAPRQKDHVFANAFWSLIFLGLSEGCIRRGYFATLNVIASELDEKLKHRILRGHSMDGYVLIGREVADEAFDVLQNTGKPMIVLGHDVHHKQLPSVDVDNVGGAYKAVQYLFKLGHQRIGLVAGRVQTQEAQDRVEGYAKAHYELGVALDEALSFPGEFSHRSGYRSMQRLLLHRPTAVFCTSDAQAMGALLAIHEAGLRVPRDISVIGYDGLPSARFTYPPLTTMQQPIYSMGRQTSDTLIDLIEDKHSGPQRIMLRSTLIERESCGPPPLAA